MAQKTNRLIRRTSQRDNGPLSNATLHKSVAQQITVATTGSQRAGRSARRDVLLNAIFSLGAFDLGWTLACWDLAEYSTPQIIIKGIAIVLMISTQSWFIVFPLFDNLRNYSELSKSVNEEND